VKERGIKLHREQEKIPALFNGNGMLLVLEQSTFSVKARLTASKARLVGVINFNGFQSWK
jgi:hypothetical protein